MGWGGGGGLARYLIVFVCYCVGCKDAIMGRVFKDLFQTPYFRIVVVDDEESVELCGALKVCDFVNLNQKSQ